MKAAKPQHVVPAPCPCGGDTYVDDFTWPGRACVFFLRCLSCGAMSDKVETAQQASELVIRSEQVGVVK